MIRIGEFILFCLLFCSGVGTNVCCSISTLLTYFLGFDIPTILILLFRFFHVHSLQWLQTCVSLNYAIWECCIFMARRAIPMITFPRVRTIYMWPWMWKSVVRHTYNLPSISYHSALSLVKGVGGWGTGQYTFLTRFNYSSCV